MARNKADIVRDVYAAFKAGDREKLAALIDPNVVWHGNEGNNRDFSGTTHSLQAFFDKAFHYLDVIKEVEIKAHYVLTDGKIAMSRQSDLVTRKDGTQKLYWFNVYYEFNDNDQIKEVWEASTSDWSQFP